MKAGLITYLNAGQVNRILNSGVDTLLYFKMGEEVDTSQFEGIKLIAAGEGYVQACELAWKGFRKQMSQLRKQLPEVMKFRDYDLEDCYCKGLHWRFQDQWLLDYAAGIHLAEAQEKIDFDPVDSPLKQRLRLGRSLIKSLLGGRDPHLPPLTDAKGKLGLLVTEMAMQNLWMGFPEGYGWENLLYYGTRQKHDPQIREFTSERGVPYFEFPAEGSDLHLPFGSLIGLATHADPALMGHILDLRLKVISQLLAYEHLAKSGATGFFTMAGENTSEGLAAGMVAEKFGLKSFNYLNGAKNATMTNRHVNFDYWFMHDEAMENLMASISDMSRDQLPITGHLTEDLARNHTYAGTMDEFRSHWEGKKVLILFGSPLYFEAQNMVKEELEQFFDRHPDWVGLFRSHPRVKDPILPDHPAMIRLPIPDSEKMTESLFDLFTIGHIAISFASTVSFQSLWFPLRTINFELRETSAFEFVDGEEILHASDVEQLRTLMEKPLTGEKRSKSSDQSVVEKMVEIIRSEIGQ